MFTIKAYQEGRRHVYECGQYTVHDAKDGVREVCIDKGFSLFASMKPAHSTNIYVENQSGKTVDHIKAPDSQNTNQDS